MSLSEAIEEGKVEVWMDGKKLQGGFMLIRTDQQEPRWLLIRINGEAASPDTEPDQETIQGSDSALTGRPVEEIAEEHNAPA